MTTTTKKTTVKRAVKVEDKIRLLDELKREAKGLDEQIKDIQREVLAAMLKRKDKTLVVDVEGNRTVKATLVQPTNTRLDAEKLEVALGEKTWLLVSTRVLDQKKLEARIATEEVDAGIVAECTTTTPGTSYVKIT